MSTCAITVGIPTYKRTNSIIECLGHISDCDPKPDEIIVHVDGGDEKTERALRDRFPEVTIISSDEQIGPGGGRNRIIAAAKNAIVASFDDDSYPMDVDFFSRLHSLFDKFPEAAVIAMRVYEPRQPIVNNDESIYRVADFGGSGCAYRKNAFTGTSGYVSLPIAYGMEEVDLALRLYGMGWKILRSHSLRAFHDTEHKNDSERRVVAATLANRALLIYLRYPVVLWWIGAAQYLKLLTWLIVHGRVEGILDGVFGGPKLIWRHRKERRTVSIRTLLGYLRLRRNPDPIVEH